MLSFVCNFSFYLKKKKFIHELQSEFSHFSDYLFNDMPRTIAAFLVNTYIRSSTLLIYIPSLSCLRRHNVKITILYNLKINYGFSFIVHI